MKDNVLIHRFYIDKRQHHVVQELNAIKDGQRIKLLFVFFAERGPHLLKSIRAGTHVYHHGRRAFIT